MLPSFWLDAAYLKGDGQSSFWVAATDLLSFGQVVGMLAFAILGGQAPSDSRFFRIKLGAV